ncbi:hypothetical protein ACFSTA_03890 [Ornithinibacillus salinisoli]|uniref:DUF2089 domain-containing protein n=1 Tax=Ornithinibacillus salinisoli TaxID=1848459 RepID=A0ABW4VXT5_9BACI
MKEEIAKVLQMMEAGKIDASKATELIQLLKEKEEAPKQKKTNYMDKTLKIRVLSDEKDTVTVNLPIRLVNVVLKAGHGIAASLPESEKYVKDLDIDLILEAIDQELEGQIVDINSAEGEKVAIFVE